MKRTYGLIIFITILALMLLLLKILGVMQADQPAKISVSPTPTPTMIAPKTVDYKAKYAIYTNGTKRTFTASMYHNLSKDVFIEASDPSIVHVKKDGITWMDFFLTLPMKLDKDCLTTGTKETFCATKNATLKFYLNGVRNDKLLFTAIKDGDLALISYGTENEAQIKSQLNSLEPTSE